MQFLEEKKYRAQLIEFLTNVIMMKKEKTDYLFFYLIHFQPLNK
jgi:hypothetical protein